MESRIIARLPRIILFDYGGVVADHYCQPYLNSLSSMLGVTPQRVLDEISEATDHGSMYRLDRISMEDFWTNITDRIGCRSINITEAQRLWAESYIPNPAILSLIRFLRKNYQVLTGLVLNEDRDRLRHILAHSCNLASYFDVIYASCEIGLLKPSKEFYDYIITHNPWGLSAYHALVVDDRESHVRVPREMGFLTYRHTSPGESNLYLSKLFDKYEKANNR